MALGHKLDDMAKERLKKERFLKTRMWITTISSMIFPDIGNIFEGIGNRIFIANNQYVTANALSAVIVVEELSGQVPAAFTAKILKLVKEKSPGTIVDFSIKNLEYKPDLKSGGLESRERNWRATLSNPLSSPISKERAARALYSVDVLKTGVTCFKSRLYITVRAKKGSTVNNAVKLILGYLAGKDADIRQIKSDMETHLKYIALLHDVGTDKMRDVGYNVLDAETLARCLPTTQGISNKKGVMMGINRKRMSAHFLDFQANAKGKNLAMIGITGFGKTFAIISWLIDFFALKYNIIINDVKGNDYNGICNMFKGKTINLGPNSRRYVNTFKLNPEGVTEYLRHYQDRFRISKEMLIILSAFKEDQEVEGANIIEEFLHSMYTLLGVLPENPKTWYRTEELTPYVVYEYFLKYCSSDMKTRHGKLLTDMISNLKTYLSITGSSSIMFREEYTMEELKENRIIRFSFDMLQNSGVQDERMLRVKYLFMEIMMQEFVQYKKARGEWTVVVEEEAQIANDYLLEVYARCNTLWRALNVVTLMSCNSYEALKKSKLATAILENINMVCLGVINKSSRDSIIADLELEEYKQEILNINSKDPIYENCFLLVNKMDRRGGATVIKEYMPPNIVDSELFKNVDKKTS